MPLHTQIGYEKPRVVGIQGLFCISNLLFENAQSISGAPYPVPDAKERLHGEFRLVQPGDLVSALNDDTWLSTPGPLPEELLKGVQSVQETILNHDPNHWLWVQRFSDCCWVFDAQESPPRNSDYQIEDLQKYIVAVVDSDRPRMERLYERAVEDNAPLEYSHTSSNGLIPSLISSFHTGGAQKARAHWPDKISNVELYTFMQDDVSSLLIPGGKEISAVQAMAKLWNESLEINRIAQQLATAFKPLKIRGFATFIPELLDKDDSRRYAAKRAIVFLARLAKSLGGKQQHPVDTIEIVGGSIVDGVLPVIYKGQNCILALRKKTGAPEGDLLEEIRDIARDVENNGCRLAIEIEPGPLFAFSTEAGVNGLIAQIEKLEAGGELPRGAVGLNLDVGHWILSNIDAIKLRDKDLNGRIFSSHISDHSKCHTGDCIVHAINRGRVFEDWISEIARLPKPSFSGVISVEFECAKSATMLQTAVDSAMKLI